MFDLFCVGWSIDDQTLLSVFGMQDDRFAFSAFCKIVQARHACKTFDKGRTVNPRIINALLEATVRAPSSWNTQPYFLIVVLSKEAKEALAEAMAGPNHAHVLDASFSVVFVADPEPRLPPDAPEFAASVLTGVSLKQSTPRTWAVKQTMIAAGFFMLAATAHCLQTNPMEGFKSLASVREARPVFGLVVLCTYFIHESNNLSRSDASLFHSLVRVTVFLLLQKQTLFLWFARGSGAPRQVRSACGHCSWL